MLKYLTHKLRTQSINASSSLESHSGLSSKDEIDGHDSGTESDGDIDVDDPDQIEEQEMDLSMNSPSRQDTSTSPSDSVTLCSSESPIFLGPSSLNPLGMYDQAHSSEEELEVINGPSPSKVLSDLYQNGSNGDVTNSSCSSVAPGVEISPKRCCSSTLLEKRKRSLAHNSDEEVRHLLEKQQNLNHHHQQQHHLLAPVNFRTSPPLEALKPYRGHILRPTTPLVLAERGIENIRISTPINNSQQQTSSNNSNSKQCDSPTQASSDSVLVQQQQQLLKDRHECSSRSISPPAKMFHCAVSPTRSLNGVSSATTTTTNASSRSSRHHHSRNQNQRLQRPYRPCLDFDKMQQLKARSIASWRHSNEHSGGEFSVFCW